MGVPDRFRLRVGTTVLLAAASTLVTCSAEPTRDPNSEEPVRDGRLTFASETEPACLDPHLSGQDATAMFGRTIFDSLVAEDREGRFHPWLASSWRVSPDRTRFTFQLRQDVRFHDGTVLDAGVVKANLDRIAALGGGSEYAPTLLGPYRATQVVDRYTAQVDFSQPFAPFLQAASQTFLAIQSAKALRGNGTNPAVACERPVGSGPFVFAGRTRGRALELRRNPGYNWAPRTSKHAGGAYVDQISVRFLPDHGARMAALRERSVDLVNGVPADQLAAVRSDPNLRLLTAEQPGMAYGLHLNGSRPPLQDRRIRTALQRGLDIDGLVRTVHAKLYRRAWGPLTPATPEYHTGVERGWPTDLALANRLLDEAGYTGRDAQAYRTRNGQRLVLDWAPPRSLRENRGRLAVEIQRQAAARLGIQLVRSNQPGRTPNDFYATGDYHLADTSWVRADPDILRGFFASYNRPDIGGQNLSRVRQPRLDQWLDTAARTYDPTVRREAYAQAQRYVVEQALVIPVYVPAHTVASWGNVRGIEFDAQAYPLFYDVSVGGG